MEIMLAGAFFSLQISMNVFWILGNVHLEPARTWMAPTDVFAHLGTAYSKTNVKVGVLTGGAKDWGVALESPKSHAFVMPFAVYDTFIFGF